jgi:hypothetical protein
VGGGTLNRGLEGGYLCMVMKILSSWIKASCRSKTLGPSAKNSFLALVPACSKSGHIFF